MILSIVLVGTGGAGDAAARRKDAPARLDGKIEDPINPEAGAKSVSLRQLRCFFSEGEIYVGGRVRRNGDLLAPRHGVGKNGALHSYLGQDVIDGSVADHSPSFVPGDNFVIAGRNIGQLEPALLVGYGVVRVWRDYHFAVHPDVASIASQADYARAAHGASDLLAFGGKRQVVIGTARHMHGVQ